MSLIRKFWSAVCLPERLVRIAFIPAIAVMGAAQTWDARHYVNPDGISYAEIATAYLRGDWSAAVSTYWSPLYSWLLALTWRLFQPSPYWEIAIAHAVVFSMLLLSIPVLELLLHELEFLRETPPPGRVYLPHWTTVLAGYSGLYFGGLGVVGLGFCSPDMFALGLTLLLTALTLRMARKGAGSLPAIGFGVLCALGYFARAAFLPLVAIWIGVFAVLLMRRGRPFFRPVVFSTAAFVLCVTPYLLAMKNKAGAFTLGETGRLNYAWEVCDVTRWIHWQGGPDGLGTPLHPTRKVMVSPPAFTFEQPIPGGYPPWYNPAYWYAGVHPTATIRQQSWMSFINLTIAANLLIRSPVFLPSLVLALFVGFAPALKRAAKCWPVWLPAVGGIGLYCVVFVEKRYVAANLILIWLTAVGSISIPQKLWAIQTWAPRALAVCSLVFLALFFQNRQAHPLRWALHDLRHWQEGERNVDALLAEGLRHLGLRPGDKVAYVGTAIRAEWVRLAGVQVVAEVPVIYHRARQVLYNGEIDDPVHIHEYWNSPLEVQEEVLKHFREAGAKVVISDGFFDYQQATGWQRVIPENTERIPIFNPNSYTQVNSRFLFLSPPSR